MPCAWADSIHSTKLQSKVDIWTGSQTDTSTTSSTHLVRQEICKWRSVVHKLPNTLVGMVDVDSIMERIEASKVDILTYLHCTKPYSLAGIYAELGPGRC